MDYGAVIVAVVMGILIGGLTVALWKEGTGPNTGK
jgi:hypothetical protein